MQYLNFGNGSDGVLNVATSVQSPIDSACLGSIGAYTLSATNIAFEAGQLVIIHQSRGTGTGNWQLNKIVSYVAGTITLAYPLEFNFVALSQVVVIPQYSQVNITGTFSARQWNGVVGGILVFMCSGTTNISGQLSASGAGFRGGFRQDVSGNAGEGYPGFSPHQYPNGNGGSGGEKAESGSTGGGGGGNGSAGSSAFPKQITLRPGGLAYGTADLVTLPFGGGGGMGGDGWQGGNNGPGGVGGGIILVFSRIINVAGSVVSHGNDGGAYDPGHQKAAAGGGGAGGSIFLKALEINYGINLIAANGGAGGDGKSDSLTQWGGPGGSGGQGRVRLEACRITGSANSPTPSEVKGGFNFCGSLASIIG